MPVGKNPSDRRCSEEMVHGMNVMTKKLFILSLCFFPAALIGCNSSASADDAGIVDDAGNGGDDSGNQVCSPHWVDVGDCDCTPSQCEGCTGEKWQDDGCGNQRQVECEVAALGCPNTCCEGECCDVDEICYGGGCCLPDCTDKECGPDGCGGDCPPGCGPGQNCRESICEGCVFEPYGYDYNMTRRCARAVCDPDSPYYFEDTTECDSDSSWLVAVESEAELGASCPGPVNCSFLINGPESPVTMEWHPHTGDCGDNWTVHMQADHSAYPSPCPGDWWTWFVFMDHLQTSGGPYPPALETVTHHVLNFSHFTPTPDSSARVFVGGQWWWGDKARAIEFNLILEQWGNADPHPGLVVRFDTPEFEFLALDATWWGMDIAEGEDVTVDIPWGQILQDAVGNGWLVPPDSWEGVVTMSYFIGLEVKNEGIGSLWHTHFRIQHLP